jgi:hypothetical protein
MTTRTKTFFLIVAACLLGAAQAHAGIVVNLDFTTGYDTGSCPISGASDNCNRGTSLTLGPSDAPVVITARTKMGNIANPNNPGDIFSAGKTGIVYWGDMGDLGDTCVSPSAAKCPGLGVRNADGKGSQGISGAGGDSDEMIVFSWAPGLVTPTSIILTLQGFKAADDETWVYLEFASNTNPGGPDYVFKWESLTSGLTLDFSTIAGLSPYSSEFVTKLGVLENAGHTGIGGLTYTTPEPAAFVLTGLPLLALGMFLKRRHARKAGR